MMDFTKPIRSAQDAEAFIRQLHEEDLLFHFDDSPDTIINASGERVFTDAECEPLGDRVDELFQFLADPFELACELTNPEGSDE